MGAEPALVVEHQFLGGEPAHALHEAALDLADIDGGIEGAADIMQDVDPVQTISPVNVSMVTSEQAAP